MAGHGIPAGCAEPGRKLDSPGPARVGSGLAERATGGSSAHAATSIDGGGASGALSDAEAREQDGATVDAVRSAAPRQLPLLLLRAQAAGGRTARGSCGSVEGGWADDDREPARGVLGLQPRKGCAAARAAAERLVREPAA